jgi:hypothetical protein
MNWKKCPLGVGILGGVYIGVGAIGFVYHFGDLVSRGAVRYDGVWVELVEVLAVVFGAFMLRGRNWARWGALAWIGFHVVLSAFHAFGEFAFHALFFAVIAWVLFRSEAARYFRGPSRQTT